MLPTRNTLQRKTDFLKKKKIYHANINHKKVGMILLISEEADFWEFPGGSVVRIQCFHCHGPGSTPCQGTKILQVTMHSQKEKKKKAKNPQKVDIRTMNMTRNQRNILQLNKGPLKKNPKCEYINKIELQDT